MSMNAIALWPDGVRRLVIITIIINHMGKRTLGCGRNI